MEINLNKKSYFELSEELIKVNSKLIEKNIIIINMQEKIIKVIDIIDELRDKVFITDDDYDEILKILGDNNE